MKRRNFLAGLFSLTLMATAAVATAGCTLHPNGALTVEGGPELKDLSLSNPGKVTANTSKDFTMTFSYTAENDLHASEPYTLKVSAPLELGWDDAEANKHITTPLKVEAIDADKNEMRATVSFNPPIAGRYGFWIRIQDSEGKRGRSNTVWFDVEAEDLSK